MPPITSPADHQPSRSPAQPITSPADDQPSRLAPRRCGLTDVRKLDLRVEELTLAISHLGSA